MPSQFTNIPASMGGYAGGQGTTPFQTGLSNPGGGGSGGTQPAGGYSPAAGGGFEKAGMGTNGSVSGGLSSWHEGLPTASDFAPGFGYLANTSGAYGASPGGGGGGGSPGGSGGYGALPDKAISNPQPQSSGAYGFDGGGMIPDGEEAPAGGGSIMDPQAALGAVQKALAFGRSLFKLPASMFGGGGEDTSAPTDESEGTPEDNYRQTDNTQDSSGNTAQTSGAAGSDGRQSSFDAGGVIPARPAGPGGDQEDANPFDTKTAPVPFGKRREVPGYAAGGVIDEGDMGNPDTGMPQQPQDNAPTDGPGANLAMPQMPPGLKPYVMGAGAMPADQALALEQRVDPQGQMDPAQRKLMAIANAGDPKQQFGLMQHYRQRFQLLNAYATAAAQGSPNRPANLQEAAQAATRAYHNVPTGQSVSFAPAGNGIHVHIGQLGQQQPQQGFDDGGTVADDQAAITGSPDYDAVPGLSGVLPEGNPDDTPVDTQGMPGSSTITGPGAGSQGAGKDFTVTIPDFIKNFLQTPWDKHVEKGVQPPQGSSHETVQQEPDMPAPQQPAALDQEDERAPGGKDDNQPGIGAGHNYRPIGVPDQRASNSLGGETDQFTVPAEDGSGPAKVSVTNGPQMMRHVPTKDALAYLTNQNRGMSALERAVLTEAGRNSRNASNVQARRDIAGEQVAGRSANSRLRFGSARLNAERNLGQQPNVDEINNEADQIEGAPRAPQPGVQPPSQNDVAYLLSHPEMAQKFDARFGAGAAAKYMRQQ